MQLPRSAPASEILSPGDFAKAMKTDLIFNPAEKDDIVIKAVKPMSKNAARSEFRVVAGIALSPPVPDTVVQTPQGRITPSSQQRSKQALTLIQNPQWLAQASERVEKTIEMINLKKVDDALQSLLELDQVFEQSGICVSSIESESTQDTSLVTQSHDFTKFTKNKTAI